MFDPETVRQWLGARQALDPRAPEAVSLGRQLLDALRGLRDDLEALLPELAACPGVASRPNVRVLSVGWSVGPRHDPEAPRLGLSLDAARLTVRWGRGPSTSASPARSFAWEASRRRALGDALLDRLAGLRADGASLFRSARELTPLSESEWVEAPAGVVCYALSLDPEGDPWRVRRAAEKLARLYGFGLALGLAEALDAPTMVRPPNDLGVEAVRDLRFDERALGEGTAPRGHFVTGRSYAYDPVTGWFLPDRWRALAVSNVARQRLLLDAGWALPELPPPPPRVPALCGRLGRWLAQRGVSEAFDAADEASIRVLGGLSVDLSAPPPLEALLEALALDPAGEIGWALAGLLMGAPWAPGAVSQPAAVAARVPVAMAASAAAGHARLRTLGLVDVTPDGRPGALETCLGEPSIVPLLALAIERALRDATVFAGHPTLRLASRSARPWELSLSAHRAASLEQVARRLGAYARSAHMAFSLDTLRALLVGLKVRPFAVLMGTSGTGKTRLAQLVARFMTAGLDPDPARVALVPVRPDWIDPRGVLGYLNVLHGAGAYEDTPALRVMLRAAAKPDEPHFLIFDEMNLARVEHYLAEVLSAIESRSPVPLHGRPGGVRSVDGERLIPPEVSVGSNLFLFGTLNLDETTFALSTKVLDRAFCWELPPALPSQLLGAWLTEGALTAPADDTERAALRSEGRTGASARDLALTLGRHGVGARIDRFFEAFQRHGRPFGYRVATELVDFVRTAEDEGLEVAPNWALDHAVLGKLLPRLSGPERALDALIESLIDVCYPERSRPAGRRDGEHLAEPDAPRLVDLAVSAQRLRQLAERLDGAAYVTFGQSS